MLLLVVAAIDLSGMFPSLFTLILLLLWNNSTPAARKHSITIIKMACSSLTNVPGTDCPELLLVIRSIVVVFVLVAATMNVS